MNQNSVVSVVLSFTFYCVKVKLRSECSQYLSIKRSEIKQCRERCMISHDNSNETKLVRYRPLK